VFIPLPPLILNSQPLCPPCRLQRAGGCTHVHPILCRAQPIHVQKKRDGYCGRLYQRGFSSLFSF
jgi:hypothetical protein